MAKMGEIHEANMARIVVDPQLQEQLHALTEPAELCDEQGRVIGRFVPQLDIGSYMPLTPQVSEDELRRREQSTEWFTTAEVLDHLGKK